MSHVTTERVRLRPRVLLTTEGTYPYVVGGVSAWCDLLVRSIREIDWHVLPIVAGRRRAPLYRIPPAVRLQPPIELWAETLAGARGPARADGHTDTLPRTLVESLIGWDGDLEALTAALTACRGHAPDVRRTFRSRRGWESFLAGLRTVTEEDVPEAGATPNLDLVEAATLYQILYWVARTAAAPTPPCDVLHVTAAGWAAIPAIVAKALHGTPLVLTEHGVYVREAYLAAARSGESPGTRFARTRLARGLARAAYAAADVVAPVTDANAFWEVGLGIDPAKIHVVYNGLSSPGAPQPPPRNGTVVSVGRIDPLKDVHTMLRVADEVLRRVPSARFEHYGPVTDGEETYGRSCLALHERLGLGDRFRFMGRTTDPEGVVRDADVVLMTSISEGLPIAILEAMAQARPVVSTGVGGVPDVVKGCGIVTRPGDVHALALAVCTLLRRPETARQLGMRGHRRVRRIFDETSCVEGYRDLLLAAARGVAQPEPAIAQVAA
jgi:glycosyltransferase involved in cell wall biosynthesis